MISGVVFLVFACSRQECPPSISLWIEKAIKSPQNSQAQVDALKTLEKAGNPIDIPEDIWFNGPSAVAVDDDVAA